MTKEQFSKKLIEFNIKIRGLQEDVYFLEEFEKETTTVIYEDGEVETTVPNTRVFLDLKVDHNNNDKKPLDVNAQREILETRTNKLRQEKLNLVEVIKEHYKDEDFFVPSHDTHFGMNLAENATFLDYDTYRELSALYEDEIKDETTVVKTVVINKEDSHVPEVFTFTRTFKFDDNEQDFIDNPVDVEDLVD